VLYKKVIFKNILRMGSYLSPGFFIIYYHSQIDYFMRFRRGFVGYKKQAFKKIYVLHIQKKVYLYLFFGIVRFVHKYRKPIHILKTEHNKTYGKKTYSGWRMVFEEATYTVKRLMIFPSPAGMSIIPNSPWPGMIKLFFAREEEKIPKTLLQIRLKD
jgi:hypothetical protein